MRWMMLALLGLTAVPAAAETWSCKFPSGGPEGGISQNLTIKLDPDWGTAQVTDPNLASVTDIPMEGNYETPSKAQRKVTWKTPFMDRPCRNLRSLSGSARDYRLIYFPANGTAVISFRLSSANPSDLTCTSGRADGACSIGK